MICAYVRVSTFEQCVDRQMDELASQSDEVHVEQGVSAVAKRRPVYEQVLKKLKAGDVFLVHSLDRAFRSVIDALTEVDKMQERGIEFRSISQQIDLTSPDGVFNFTLRAAFAQLERSILSTRTKEGLASARRRGVTLGRPRLLSSDQVELAKKQFDARKGHNNLCELADNLNVSSQTLRRALSS